MDGRAIQVPRERGPINFSVYAERQGTDFDDAAGHHVSGQQAPQRLPKLIRWDRQAAGEGYYAPGEAVPNRPSHSCHIVGPGDRTQVSFDFL